jgi:divinyl protochlorophyllide a 8-vinyl-reductase
MNATVGWADAPAPAARIGPNAITRVAEALRSQGDEARTREVFSAAGLAQYLAKPPERMVDENEVIRLHRALAATLGEVTARAVARSAGLATARYLLAHRIPRPFQAIVRRLPAQLAAFLLLAAIRRHAWTFAGSGAFAARAGRPTRLSISANPMCRGLHAEQPACDYYAATFEGLFRALVHPRATVNEIGCEACGADACRFEIDW